MLPARQTLCGRDPEADISACHPPAPPGDGSQAFMFGVRRDRVVAKTVQPVQGSDPNITFAIFEERGNEIAREAISLRKYVGAPLMEMHNTFPRGSNPDAAIAVPEKYYAINVAGRSGVRMLRLQFRAPKAGELSRQRNQKGSVAGLT